MSKHRQEYVHAVRPWSVDSEKIFGKRAWNTRRKEGCSEEDMKCCMDCPLPAEKCRGVGFCYRDSTGDTRVRNLPGSRFDKERFLAACATGKTTRQLAREFGVTTRSINAWKERAGVEPKWRRGVEREVPEGFREAFRSGMTKRDLCRFYHVGWERVTKWIEEVRKEGGKPEP